jgi:hypothetical protein
MSGPRPTMRSIALLAAMIATACSASATPDGGTDAPRVDGGVPDVPAPVDGGELPTDAGGGALETCFDGMSGTDEIPLDVLRFTSAGGTEVRLARIYEAQGPGFSVIFGIRGLAVRHGAVEECITAAAALGYQNTHHNWYDAATASAAHDYRLEMDIVLDSSPIRGDLTLTVDGGAPIDLTYGGCSTVPATAMERGCFFFLPAP